MGSIRWSHLMTCVVVVFTTSCTDATEANPSTPPSPPVPTTVSVDPGTHRPIVTAVPTEQTDGSTVVVGANTIYCKEGMESLELAAAGEMPGLRGGPISVTRSSGSVRIDWGKEGARAIIVNENHWALVPVENGQMPAATILNEQDWRTPIDKIVLCGMPV